MCGEHLRSCCNSTLEPGSSPHVRGAHTSPRNRRQAYGIIPACAGSTRFNRFKTEANGDHPRMCGEHVPQDQWQQLVSGSSPHVRGAPVNADKLAANAVDHPRMCGEHCRDSKRVAIGEGSSPHVRGAHQSMACTACTPGIIPACAGSTDPSNSELSVVRDHPRMCGEHDLRELITAVESGSSPHVRGAHNAVEYSLASGGIIPACAGSTNSPST